MGNFLKYDGTEVRKNYQDLAEALARARREKLAQPSEAGSKSEAVTVSSEEVRSETGACLDPKE